jgi:uncharacterized protein (DUF885 family)
VGEQLAWSNVPAAAPRSKTSPAYRKYIGASAGCWEIYGEILAKEFGEYRYPEPTHQLTVHT